MIDPWPLRGAPIAVLDFETTGPDPSTCEPVSVAVVIIDALGITAPRLAYSTLINPGVPIPPESTAIHGITDEDVLDAPGADEVRRELVDVVGARVVAAYNLPFEWAVWWRRPGGPPPLRGICALVMAREVDKYEKGTKLADVAARRGIRLDAHKADSDAMATALLLPIFLRELGRGVRRQKWGRTITEGPWCRPSDLHSVEAFLWWTRRAGAEQEQELAAYFAKQGKGPLDSTPWLDLKAAYEARTPRVFRESEHQPKTTHQDLPADWFTPWQAKETAA